MPASHPRRRRGAAPPPSVALVFFRHGRKFAEAGPFTGKLEKGSAQKASYFAQIPLEKFPAGRYTLQVNVLDPAERAWPSRACPWPSLSRPRVLRTAGGRYRGPGGMPAPQHCTTSTLCPESNQKG